MVFGSSLAAVSWGAYDPAEHIIVILFFGLPKRICDQIGGAEKNKSRRRVNYRTENHDYLELEGEP